MTWSCFTAAAPPVDRVQPDRDDRLDQLLAVERPAEREPLQHPVVELEQHGGQRRRRRCRPERPRRRARSRSCPRPRGRTTPGRCPTARAPSCWSRGRRARRGTGARACPRSENSARTIASMFSAGVPSPRSWLGGRERLVVHLLHECRDGAGLVLEVEVERRAGDAGAARDVGDVDRLEAALAQVVVERLEQRAYAGRSPRARLRRSCRPALPGAAPGPGRPGSPWCAGRARRRSSRPAGCAAAGRCTWPMYSCVVLRRSPAPSRPASGSA